MSAEQNPKECQINTVQDMVDHTTPENLDNFLADLRGIIKAAHALRTVAPIEMDGFTWIDDGKNHLHIDISQIYESKITP